MIFSICHKIYLFSFGILFINQTVIKLAIKTKQEIKKTKIYLGHIALSVANLFVSNTL